MTAKLYRFSFLFIFPFLLNGCYVADQLLTEEPTPVIPLQKKCEKSIELYIKNQLDGQYYIPYRFTEAVIHVPQELAALEEIEKSRDEGFSSGAETDSNIVARRKYLEENNVQRTAILEHHFALKDPSGVLHVIHAKYILDDTLGVIDFVPIMFADFTEEYEIPLQCWYTEYTLFKHPDYVLARRLSNRFYYFFKTRYNEISTIKEKSDFFKHSIRVLKYVYDRGEFDNHLFVQSEIELLISTLNPPLENYNSIDFSPLYEKSENGKTLRYYIFHKFSHAIGGTDTLSALQFEFSPYYEFESASWLEPPFENYFQNQSDSLISE